MSTFGQSLCQVRVNAPRGAYRMSPEDIQEIADRETLAISNEDGY